MNVRPLGSRTSDVGSQSVGRRRRAKFFEAVDIQMAVSDCLAVFNRASGVERRAKISFELHCEGQRGDKVNTSNPRERGVLDCPRVATARHQGTDKRHRESGAERRESTVGS